MEQPKVEVLAYRFYMIRHVCCRAVESKLLLANFAFYLFAVFYFGKIMPHC